MKNPLIFFAPSSFQSPRFIFFVLFHLRLVNFIGTSCTEVIQSIIMQVLNQGGTIEKIIEKHVTIGIFQDFS